MRFPDLVHRNVLYPLALWLRGEHGMYGIRDRLVDLQWESVESLDDYIRRKLLATLRYAGDHVPWYRDKLCPGASDAELLDAFHALSPVTKRDLQEARESFVSDDLPWRTMDKTTGGSTWEPVTVKKDARAIAHERAATWMAYGWYGIEIGDRGARFWGVQTSRGLTRLWQLVTSLITNQVWFSAFRFSDDDLERYWQRCLDTEPHYFYGYVSMLTEFAHHVRDRGHDGRRLGLTAIVTTAEVLTGPQRQLLENTFGAPVRNEYGCGEVGPIAYECPEGSLHVMSDNVFIEVIRDDGRPAGRGETGRVFLTDLNNRAMPLIRYRVGDSAVKGGRCECGRAFPVLRRVWGREDDFVEDPGGHRYHGEYFIHLMEELPDLDQKVGKVRVVQPTRSEIRIEVESTRDLSARDRRKVIDRIQRDMEGVTVQITEVARIPRLDSGKTRVIENEWARE